MNLNSVNVLIEVVMMRYGIPSFHMEKPRSFGISNSGTFVALEFVGKAVIITFSPGLRVLLISLLVICSAIWALDKQLQVVTALL